MAKKKKKDSDRFKEIRNSKVHRDYFVEKTYEAGIVLTGTEIKSVRANGANISDGFCRIGRGKLMLYHAHIKEYAFGTDANHEPYRPRQLLLNKKEMDELEQILQSGGRALVPTKMYFKKALLKCEIAVCIGKKNYDKREDMKKKDATRDMERAYKYQ